MESENSGFGGSLKEQGIFVGDLIKKLKIDRGDCSRAGMLNSVLDKVLAGDLKAPLDMVIFGDLVRIFELKQPGFRKSTDYGKLHELWLLTQREYSKNGGSKNGGPKQEQEVTRKEQDSKANYSIKKNAAWIMSVILKKLLTVRLIDRANFQRITGISREILEEVIRGQWTLHGNDEIAARIVGYVSPFLEPLEARLLENVLAETEALLTAEQISMICAPVPADEIEKRKRRGSRICKERSSWANMDRGEILQEILFSSKLPSRILEELMLLYEFNAESLAQESGCSIKNIKNALYKDQPIGEKDAKRLVEVFELNDYFAALFLEAVTDSKAPPIIEEIIISPPPAIILPSLSDEIAQWNLKNGGYFPKIILFPLNGNHRLPAATDCLLLTYSPVIVAAIPVSNKPENILGLLMEAGRVAKKMTQRELANKAGCSQKTISCAERGIHIPLECFVRSVAQILGFRNKKKAAFYKAAGVSYP